jgi:hypothetical protein
MNGPLHPIPPLGPFQKWGVDLMGPLPVTRKGHRFIVVTINYITKFAKIRALKSSLKQEINDFCMSEYLPDLGHHSKLFLIMIPGF